MSNNPFFIIVMSRLHLYIFILPISMDYFCN